MDPTTLLEQGPLDQLEDDTVSLAQDNSFEHAHQPSENWSEEDIMMFQHELNNHSPVQIPVDATSVGPAPGLDSDMADQAKRDGGKILIKNEPFDPSFQDTVENHLYNEVQAQTEDVKPFPVTMHRNEAVPELSTRSDHQHAISHNSDKITLQRGIRLSEEPEQIYRCNLCDVEFAQKSNLVNHMRTHTGEKPYKCSSCDYTCARKTCLVRHTRTHTGEKPYKCSMCDYCCSHKSGLSRHIRSHTAAHMKDDEEKPHKCSFCEYRTSRTSDLYAHLRTHTGEKPYKCSSCDYSCAHKPNLAVHMKRHAGDKPHKCSLCGYSSVLRNQLAVHMRSHTVHCVNLDAG